MRKNYFVKLLRYMKNVYQIDCGLSRLTDRRVYPKYKTPQVILIILLAFQLRIQSMNELKYLLKENEFRSLFPAGTLIPCIDTIIDTLKSIDIVKLKAILKHIIKKAQKNKVFQNGTIGGLTVAAIDGSKLFGSNVKSCPECMTNLTFLLFLHMKKHLSSGRCPPYKLLLFYNIIPFYSVSDKIKLFFRHSGLQPINIAFFKVT